jgi:two-component system OmpR family sensor kinase
MRQVNSLQWRLSISLVTGVALMWIAASLLTYKTLQSEMNEVFDAALEETAQRILPLAVNDIIDREEEGVSQRVAVVRNHQELLTYLVRDDLGRVLLRSHVAKDDVFPPFKQIGFTDTASHRIYFDAALQGTINIAVAEPLDHRIEVMRESFLALIMPLALLIPASLYAVWWLVRVSMRPVRVFRAEIETRDSADLTPVASDALPQEIKPIAESVNSLMSHLSRTLESERSFTANSAHELRTPVAAALAQTQRLIVESNDTDTLKRAGQIELALKRLAALSEKLMQLAKSEGGSLIAAESKDIIPVLELVINDFAQTSDAANRIMVNLPDRPVLIRMDPNSFAILMRNLIENALKHGDPESAVRVYLSTDGLLRVVNGGKVVPGDILKNITRPFVRGQSTEDGTGLGLAIASAIITGSGGSINFASPATGCTDGFEVIIQLA